MSYFSYKNFAVSLEEESYTTLLLNKKSESRIPKQSVCPYVDIKLNIGQKIYANFIHFMKLIG